MAHEQAIALGQADRGAHAPAGPARHERHAEVAALLAALEQALDGGAHDAGRQRQEEAGVRAQHVQPEHGAVGVDERATAGAARQRGGVLDDALDRSPVTAADGERPGRDPALGHAQAARAGVGEREDDVADLRRGVGEAHGRRVAGRDLEERDAVAAVNAPELAVAVLAVGEDDLDRRPGDRMRQDGDPVLGDDDARSAPRPAAQSDDRSAHIIGETCNL